MNILRIYISADNNELGFKILDEFNSVLGEHYGEHSSYRDFFDRCDDAILSFDCVELDTIWLDEIIDLLHTYSDEDAHPFLWGLVEDA